MLPAKRFSMSFFKPIDQEEKDLMESIERGEWKPAKDFDGEKDKAIAASRNTMKKDKRINLRLTKRIITRFRARLLNKAYPIKRLFPVLCIST